LKAGTDSFATLIWTTHCYFLSAPFTSTLTRSLLETNSAANFLPYKTTVFHKLCYIDHETEFCALLPSWGEWQQKQSPQL